MSFFNQISTGRFNSLLIRLFGMKISGAAAPSLAPEIAPSLDVNQYDDPQVFFLRGDRLAFGYVSGAAPGVNNYRYNGIVNPTNSGVLCVVTRIRVHSSTTGSVLGLVSPQAPAIGGTPSNSRQFRERRWAATVNQPTCTLNTLATTQSPAALPSGQCALYTLPTSNVAVEVVQPGIVLPPGFDFQLAHTTIQTPDLITNFEWIERPIPAEELATG